MAIPKAKTVAELHFEMLQDSKILIAPVKETKPKLMLSHWRPFAGTTREKRHIILEFALDSCSKDCYVQTKDNVVVGMYHSHRCKEEFKQARKGRGNYGY